MGTVAENAASAAAAKEFFRCKHGPCPRRAQYERTCVHSEDHPEFTVKTVECAEHAEECRRKHGGTLEAI